MWHTADNKDTNLYFRLYDSYNMDKCVYLSASMFLFRRNGIVKIAHEPFCRLIQVPIFTDRPQRSCGKVMFLHLSAILYRGVSGRHSPQAWGRHPNPPPGRHTYPWQTSPPDGHCSGRTGMHPTGMHSCYIHIVLINLQLTAKTTDGKGSTIHRWGILPIFGRQKHITSWT